MGERGVTVIDAGALLHTAGGVDRRVVVYSRVARLLRVRLRRGRFEIRRQCRQRSDGATGAPPPDTTRPLLFRRRDNGKDNVRRFRVLTTRVTSPRSVFRLNSRFLVTPHTCLRARIEYYSASFFPRSSHLRIRLAFFFVLFAGGQVPTELWLPS